jgi:hypothetical protein
MFFVVGGSSEERERERERERIETIVVGGLSIP